jgi:type IV fimbrial biogenesis protein FimT
MVSLAAPGFMIWIQNTQIRTAAEAVLNGLQTTRAEAVRRNEQVTFSLAGFDWNITDATGAVIESRLSEEGSRNVVITVIGTMPLTFNGLGRPLGGTAAVGGGNDAVQLRIVNPSGGSCQDEGGEMRCLEVRVTLSGQVRMCDPKLPGTDPQGC